MHTSIAKKLKLTTISTIFLMPLSPAQAGNNNSKPLTGAKVILDAKDGGKAASISSKYPVIRFPMERTSQTRGVTFTRIPPANDIGEYSLTVQPPSNRNSSCRPYNPPRGAIVGDDGSISIDLRKSPGPSTTRRTFNFKCSPGGTQPARANRNLAATPDNRNECHDVRVQALGAGARYGRVTLQSCKQPDGQWKIEPYRYRR